MLRLSPLLLLLPVLVTACSTPPTVEMPAADPDTPAATSAPMPRLSGDDAPTRRTNELLAAAGAHDTSALKPMDHGAMGASDHAKTGHGTGATDHGQHSAKAPAPARHGAFVCPMHPEVTSAAPAKCPKCGMALKPKAGGAPHQHRHP